MIHFQKRNLGIEKVEEAKIYLARNNLDTDTGKTFLLKIQKFGRTGRDIDDTSFAERTAIGDTDDHPLHIGQVGDTQESAERICAVGSNSSSASWTRPLGGLTAVETVVVIRSKPFLLAPHVPVPAKATNRRMICTRRKGIHVIVLLYNNARLLILL